MKRAIIACSIVGTVLCLSAVGSALVRQGAPVEAYLTAIGFTFMALALILVVFEE